MVPQTAHVNGIKTAVISPDGNYFVTAGFDYLVKIWDYKTGKLLQNKKTEAAIVNSILFIDETNFVTGDSRGFVTLHNLSSKNPVLKRKISSRQINTVKYDKKGHSFWCAGYGGFFMAVDSDSLTPMFEMKNFQAEINASAFLPEQDIILLASTSGKIYIFDTKIKSLIDSSEIFSSDISGICSFNGGTEVAAASFDGEVKFFTFNRNTGLKQTKIISVKPNSMFTSLEASPSGNIVSATTFNNEIHLIDTKSKATKSVIKAHEYTIAGFGFVDDNNGYSYSFGNRTLIWDLNNPSSPKREISGQTGDVVHFGIGSGLLVFSTSDGSVYSIDLTKSFSTTKIYQSFSSITALVFDPVNISVALGEEDGTVTIMSAKTGDQIYQSQLHSKPVLAIDLNPDYLITSSSDKAVKIISINNLAAPPVSPVNLGSRFSAIAFSNKSQTIALGSEEGLIYFVDPVTGRKESTLGGHTAPVNSLKFNLGGNFLISTSVDRTTRVWNNNDLFNFKTWQNKSGIPYDGLFLSDETILSTGDGGWVMQYELKNDSLSYFQEGTQSLVSLRKYNETAVAALSTDGIIYMWNLITGNLKYLIHLKNEVFSIFDADQSIIYSSNGQNDIFQPAGFGNNKLFEVKPLNTFRFNF
ncbi:MAG: hypothetical protein IPJ75_09845 [Ignavibacteriales bacterium]|nr:hypothetical protein [Ignavibacteriales bacterium]